MASAAPPRMPQSDRARSVVAVISTLLFVISRPPPVDVAVAVMRLVPPLFALVAQSRPVPTAVGG